MQSLHLNQLANALAEAIEKKDRYTGGHAKRTAHYALKIAREVDGVDSVLLEKVRLAAILHDVGKIGIEDAILKKSAPLDSAEWSTMREHPRLGSEIVGAVGAIQGQIDGFDEIVEGVRFHHERWDGQGYPQKLSGDRIPWIARLIAVADAYDAMVSSRPYRRGMDAGLAYNEIVAQSGRQFDPQIVEAFARAFSKINASH